MQPHAVRAFSRHPNLMTVFDGLELWWFATDDEIELATPARLTDEEYEEAYEAACKAWDEDDGGAFDDSGEEYANE